LQKQYITAKPNTQQTYAAESHITLLSSLSNIHHINILGSVCLLLITSGTTRLEHKTCFIFFFMFVQNIFHSYKHSTELQAGYTQDARENACITYWTASIIITNFRQKICADEILVILANINFCVNPFSSS
jgi:hypothetical protein